MRINLASLHRSYFAACCLYGVRAVESVVYRSRTLRLLRILTDQRRTRMGAGTLRRNGDPGNYGLHVYDTRLTTDTMTMTPNVTTRDTPD